MASPSSKKNTTFSVEKPRPNVILSAAYLMPVSGKAITAHSTRAGVLGLLEETRVRRGDGERSMIVDVSATCWNWDTYAIVAGKPSPVAVMFSDEEELRKCLPLEGGGKRDAVGEGILLPQPSGKKVWMPKGAVLKESNKKEDGMTEFIFEAPVDPNDDRLEHWEQEVVGNRHLHEWRAKLVWNSMRSMMRFYNLDRIVCWDLSWGIWEAVRDGDEACDDGFPRMKFRMEGKEDMKFPPSVKWDAGAEAEEARETIYSCCRPVGPGLLSETLTGVSGYYLVGGNTYTMSLFHNMWDREGLENRGGGHMQLLRDQVRWRKRRRRSGAMMTMTMTLNIRAALSLHITYLLAPQLKDGTIFYMGHSAGLIMSGPNILTATFKGIDAFSIVTQQYNAPFMRLPPSESPETFFAKEKNDLLSARTKMLENMSKHDAWRGFRAVEALAFPHYDARPRVASFPQSAETYLRATNERGQFAQAEASLLVGARGGERAEPEDVTRLREETNAKSLPCYPIANGHAILMEAGGLGVEEALSPVEEGAGVLHWDTYMPYVGNEDWANFAPGRDQFAAGSFTGDEDTIAGDRSSDYDGVRIFSRLEALGLPNPGVNDEGAPGRLFRSE
jgi:hypothetical protein